jgi:hypothetical protein
MIADMQPLHVDHLSSGAENLNVKLLQVLVGELSDTDSGC